MANEFKVRNGLVIETVAGSSTAEEILVHNQSSGLVERRTTLPTSSIESFNTNVSASAASQGFGNFDTTGTGIVSGSEQVSYTGITDVPSGIVSSSEQVDYTGISNVPSGIVSGAAQIDALGFYNSGDDATFARLNITSHITASGIASNGSERTPLVIDASGHIYIGAEYTADVGSGSVDMTPPDTANAVIVSVSSGSKEIKQIDATADFKNQSIQNLGKIISSGIVSGSSQVTYSGLTGVPSGIISGSSQVTYSNISGIPSGIVSGSSQVDYEQIINVPVGIISGAAQIDALGFYNEGDSPTFGIVNANKIIATEYVVSSSVTYLTTSFSSGSTKFGDSFDDVHQFTGSVDITGSFTSQDNATFNKELIVVGSGSALFQVGDDGLLKHQTKEELSVSSDTTIVSIPEASYTSLHINYFLRDTGQTAYRAGNVVYVWNANNNTYEFSETSTNDLGSSTAGIEFSGSMTGGNFNAILKRTSGTWLVRIQGSVL